jgi:hypothetical protein
MAAFAASHGKATVHREDVMLLTCLRLALLLATLVGSLHVAAAPRYWTLTSVQSGGYTVTGYFSYDDVTNTVSNWNVRVDERWAGHFLPALTYLPGNSTASTVRLSSGWTGDHLRIRVCRFRL